METFTTQFNKENQLNLYEVNMIDNLIVQVTKFLANPDSQIFIRDRTDINGMHKVARATFFWVLGLMGCTSALYDHLSDIHDVYFMNTTAIQLESG